MEVSKQEQWELEQSIHRGRHDAAVIEIHRWISLRQETVNKTWPDTAGEELSRLQGEARTLKALLRIIEDGPTIKGEIANG